MWGKLEAVSRRVEEITRLLGDPGVMGNSRELQKLGRELAELRPLAEAYVRHRRIGQELEENRTLAQSEKDPEMRALAKEEIVRLTAEKERLEAEMRLLLLPKDPNDEKNILIEIRAGAGGEEAALFASELFRSYHMYAAMKGWKVEMLAHSETGLGGTKEVIAMIEGKGAYSRLKYESGVHRVQRVPATEAGGRIHTSTVTVAVIPEAEEVDVQIGPDDLRIDVFRSSGPGGPHHPHPHGAGRIVPGREVPAEEQIQGVEDPPFEAVRPRDGEAARREGGHAPLAGRDGGPQRTYPHVQLHAEPGDRPPHRPDRPSARPGAERGNRRVRGRTDRARPGRSAQARRLKRLPSMRLFELLALCRREMEGLGLRASPEAEILVSHLSGIPRSRLPLEGNREVGDLSGALRSLLRRRGSGEPIQYLLGSWEFYGREFRLTRETLIPRPETEGLVEGVVDAWRRESRGAGKILDVGTGCGAIAVTLAAELPPADLLAVDVSAGALAVARENARALGVADRVRFFRADGYSALKRGYRFDVVVSNPPYVSEKEWDSLPREVREFEPARALVSGPDGLAVVRPLLADAGAHLEPK